MASKTLHSSGSGLFKTRSTRHHSGYFMVTF